MIYGKFIKEKKDLDAANAISHIVLEQELGLKPDDGWEEEFVLRALVFEGGREEAPAAAGEPVTRELSGEPAGTGCLLFDGACFTIAGVAVLPAYRKRGYGDFLVRLLADRATEAGAQEIRLEAFSGTEPFFGAVGFIPAGTAYEKHGTLWQPMLLRTGPVRNCSACTGSGISDAASDEAAESSCVS